MKPLSNKRDKSIDIAKGIGIIAVVWGHVGQSCPCKNEIFLFHMPLFFLLSGYLFKDEGLTFMIMLKKKVQSYLVPYIVFFTIILLLFILLYISIGYRDRIYLSPGILIHPYGVVGALWFLIALFEVHIAYYFIAKYIHKQWIKSAICLLCMILSQVFFRWGVNVPLYIGSSLSMIVFFHIGYLMHKYHILAFSKDRLVLLVFSILFYIVGIVSSINLDIKENKLEGNLALIFFAALGCSYAIVYISFLLKEYNKISLINTILSYLGQNTLIIFPTHLLCIEIARCLFKFPLSNEVTVFDGVYITLWGILGSLIIGIPIKKIILPHITITK